MALATGEDRRVDLFCESQRALAPPQRQGYRSLLLTSTPSSADDNKNLQQQPR